MKHLNNTAKSLALLMMFLLAFIGGCSSDDSTKDKDKKEEAPKTETTAEPKDLILATTTSTQDSGLLDVILPVYEEKYNVNVKTIAVGTGEALAMGQKGEADVMLVHAPKSEQELVDNGEAINYKRVMYNDFIVVGPKSDPAGVKGLTAEEAYKKIAEAKEPFISRGDDSGTHKKELQIWTTLGLEPQGQEWYVETGQGMGNTLQVGTQKVGYVFTDRATFLAQQDNLGDFEILVEGGEDLKNIYHVMQVNPEKWPKVNAESAEQFVDFMISDDTAKIIADFGVEEYGEALFFDFRE